MKLIFTIFWILLFFTPDLLIAAEINENRHYPFFFSPDFLKTSENIDIEKINFDQVPDEALEKVGVLFIQTHKAMAGSHYKICSSLQFYKEDNGIPKHTKLNGNYLKNAKYEFLPDIYEDISSLEEKIINFSKLQDQRNDHVLELFKSGFTDPKHRVLIRVLKYYKENKTKDEFIDPSESIDEFYEFPTNNYKEQKEYQSKHCPEIFDL